MDEAALNARAVKLRVILRVMAVILLLLGILLLAGAFLFLSGGAREAVSEELMIGPRFLSMVVSFMVAMVILSGALSLLRMPWGWFIHILTASLLILLALLMEPRTTLITKTAFFAMPLLALFLWATALVNYYYDLYR